MTAARSPDPSRVAERAYSIWEEEGRPHGHDRAHWERAEKELGTPATVAGSAVDATPVAGKKPARARKSAAAETTETPKPARARKGATEAGSAASPAAPKRTPRAKKSMVP
jgi:Protein of unknown function (DUF2934)